MKLPPRKNFDQPDEPREPLHPDDADTWYELNEDAIRNGDYDHNEDGSPRT